MISSSQPITAEFIILGARKAGYSRPLFGVNNQLQTNRNLKIDYAYVARTILKHHFLRHPERDQIIGIRMRQGDHTHSSYFCYDKNLIVTSSDLEQSPRLEARFPFRLTARFTKNIAMRLHGANLTMALFVYPWSMRDPEAREPPRVVVPLGLDISVISPQTGYLFFPEMEPAKASWRKSYKLLLRDASL
jgi:hypothetical protein